MSHLQKAEINVIFHYDRTDLCLQYGKGILAKSVGVIDATADTVFEVVLNTERQRRYE